MSRRIGRAAGASSGPSPSFRAFIALAFAVAIANSQAAHAVGLTSRVIRSTPILSPSLIVGRAVCDDAVWLLNEHLELTRIDALTFNASTGPVRGFQRDERPWGLACVADRTVWTLPGTRVLARVTPTGAVVDRRAIGAPATALFAAGSRLLLAFAPPVIGAALLGSAAPSRPGDARPWPGLTGRTAPSRVDLLARNLVTCGVAMGVSLPCWLADATEVVVSDGTQVRRLSLSFVAATDVDREAPMRDVALVGTGRVWVLCTSARFVNGRRAGRRLFLSVDGRELARLDLPADVRLIVSADWSTCRLLTVDGQLLEVNAR